MSMQQFNEAAVFGDDDGVSRASGLKNGGINSFTKTKVTDGVIFESERRRNPRGDRRGKLRVEPKNQAAGSGSFTRRLANSRHA